MEMDDTGKDSFIKRSFMQVTKTKKGTRFREKVYVDGKAIYSPRFQRKTDAVQWKARMVNENSSYKATGNMPRAFQKEEKILFEDYAVTWLETRVKLQL